MVTDNILKKLEKFKSTEMGLWLLCVVLLPFLSTGMTAVCSHKDGKVSLASLRLTI
jgi:hypothetical protein